jgi:cytochrome c5
MLRKLAAFALGLALAGVLPAHADPVPVFKSVSVDLPDAGATFPGGAEADTINNNCLACHSTEMVLNQPALSKAAWDGIVHKMIAVYKAPVDDKDVAAIVAYLDKTKGTGR